VSSKQFATLTVTRANRDLASSGPMVLVGTIAVSTSG
jgi:hypothetical protein